LNQTIPINDTNHTDDSFIDCMIQTQLIDCMI